MSSQDLLAAQSALGRHYGKEGGTKAERQIFLCALSEKQKCCSPEEGAVAWQHLKTQLKERGLVGPKRTPDHPKGPGGIQRSKADCLQICSKGPIASCGPMVSGITRAAPTCSTALSTSI